ncbi:MAG: hypothetical protein CMC07_09125 [Flavobacteriaceae bacterium]|nr:hypothetical protein [Flavobacteriaceae bacterium]
MRFVRKTILTNGQGISYLDNEIQSKTTILFVHGNSLNNNSFKNQFNDKDLNKYRLVAIDLPGHGESEWNKDYSIPQMTTDIATFCNQLRLINFIIVGHSLGGHLIIQSLSKLKSCKGALLIGTPPVKRPLNIDIAFMPHPVIPLLFKAELTAEELELFAESVCAPQNKKYVIKSITVTDPKFREKMMTSIMQGDLKDEILILEKIKTPVALVYGENDELVNKKYVRSLNLSNLFEQNPIFIKNSWHASHMSNSNIFNKVLKECVLEFN